MMEGVKRLWLILALLWPLSILGQQGALQGTSTLGGISATTQGAQSSNRLQGVIPAAQITIYLTGTQTLATLTSDGTHSLSNPFYSNASNAVNPGGYIAFAATNFGYDIVASSGQGLPNCTTGPLCYAQPVTLCKDCYPSSAFNIISSLTLQQYGVNVANQAKLNAGNAPNAPFGFGNVNWLNDGAPGDWSANYLVPNFLPFTPPRNDQSLAILYPTTVTQRYYPDNLPGDNNCSSGSPTAGPTASGVIVRASPYVNSVNTCTIVWGGYSLPAGISPSSVNFIYSAMIGSSSPIVPAGNETSNGFIYYSCGSNLTYSGFGWPTGGTQYGQVFGGVNEGFATNTYTGLMTGTASSFNYGAASCALADSKSGQFFGTSTTSIGFPVLLVYYTGSPAATPPPATLNFDYPLFYVPAANSVELQLPFDFAASTGVVNVDSISVPGMGCPAVGQELKYIPVGTNTSTTPTLSVNGCAAITVAKYSGGSVVPLSLGDISSSGCASSACVADVILSGASNYWILQNPMNIAGSSGVPSVNAITGAVTVAPGAGVTVSTVGSTITVGATGGGGGGGPAYNYVFAGASRNIASTTCQLTSNPPYNISSGTVSSGVATFASTQGGQPGNIFTLQGFGGSYTGLNGQTVTVLSTGFSGSQFEANVTAANGSTGAGGFVCTYSLPTQFSKMPVAIGASVFPLAVGGQTTSTELANFTSLYGAECPNTTGKPAYFMSPTGDQDILDSTSNSTIESNLQGIWAAAHACGYKVVGETAIPVQADGLAEYAQTQIAQLNTWIIGQTSSMVATPGQNWDILADLASKLSDPYNVSMFIQTGSEADHPTDSFNIAQALIINDAIFNNTESAYPISNVQGYWFMQDSTQSTSTTFGPDWMWWHNVPGVGFDMSVSLPNFNPSNPGGDFVDVVDTITGHAAWNSHPKNAYCWSSGEIGGAGQLAAPDTCFYRDSAGVVDLGNGTPGDKSGSLDLANLTVTGTCTGCSGGSSITPITIAVSSATQSANTCSSPTTATMTGVTTSGAGSHVTAGWTTDPSSATGWGSTGGMTFNVWASAANTVSWEVCNQTASGITFSSYTFSIGAQ
jgi:hypothetical protein